MFQFQQRPDKAPVRKSDNDKNNQSSINFSLEMMEAQHQALLRNSVLGEDDNAPIQKQSEEGQKKEEERLMQAKAKNLNTQTVSKGTVAKMPEDIQAKMENSFGTSFGNVSIYQNDNSAAKMGALAYTQGNDVHFAPGQYNPNTQAGQELLGHELTHVVQQRAGRVQPTKQGKGMAVNDSLALESEADVMGVKAAQGKFADVKENSFDIQKKNDKEDKKVDVNIKGGIFEADVNIPGMDLLGTYSYTNAATGRRVVRYVLAGTEKQWAQLLAKADDKNVFESFIRGFLDASNDPSWINKGDDNNWQIDKKMNISRAPEPPEILAFLKALYSQGVDTDLDLPDKMFEQGAGGYNFHSDWIVYPSFAKFIGKYQGLLIKDISLKNKNQIIREKGLEQLAEQGTLYTHVTNGNPVVIKAMIQNAYASALSAAKILIDGSVLKQEKSVDILTAFNTVYNAGKIINKAVSGYDKKIQGMKDGAKSVFNAAWGLIPLNNPVAKVIGELVKGSIEKAFVDSLGLKEMKPLIEDFYVNFNSLQGTIESILKNHSNDIDINVFINKYEIMLGKFHEGLYQ